MDCGRFNGDLPIDLPNIDVSKRQKPMMQGCGFCEDHGFDEDLSFYKGVEWEQARTWMWTAARTCIKTAGLK